MPRLALFLLTLSLLAPHTPAGVVLRSVADLLSSDSGWEMGPDGPTSSESDPDRGWEIDPNG